MAEENPTRNEINLIFKTLMNIPTNKSCFDCKTKNPTWSSVTYGVLICIDCAAVHRSLGVHLSFVRSTQLDDNWSWQQLRQMQLGGNANAQSFFETHDCRTTDAQQKYNSRAAQLYREKLANAARNAQRKYGRSLHLDSSAAVVSNEKSEKEKEFDFFEEHSNNNSGFESQFKTSQTINSGASLNGARISSRAKLSSNEENTARVASSGCALGAGSGPSIDALLSAPSTQPDVTRKPTIGTRKPQPKRTGLGAKKTGLGAERVKANFAEIEREAELADQLKMQEAEKKTVSPELNKEEEEAQLASMRLAYQDLSIKQKKEEDKLKAVDPKKAQQIERLGMGFASRSGVSHSAISDMKTIEQETPANSSNKSKRSTLMDSDTDNYFDDFNFVTTSSSGFSMYKGSSNSSPPDRDNQSGLDSMMFLDHYNCSSSSNNPSSSSNNLSSSSTTTSSRNQANKGGGGGGGWWEPQPMSATITSPADNHNNNSSSSGYSSSNRNSSRGGREAPTSTSGSNSPAGSDAQKKFGAAKAISSKQYFGDTNDSTWERKSNLSRFEGSTSISSADYFGRAETIPGGGGVGGAGIQTPDLDDVKESVRQGVTKVAGRLSSMANGFMSSLSRK
ncbi:ADP-ribosylation factor GTPase-activating protein 2 isoform X2 [Nilaparvata lugens]|uniref:ADP-ribosylation factor GTPase-activating protein 2 isoform X2 n=1 Tax=Nilaparvata lugens TaxID=108931 RepID=UPI00193E5981|nr:ADP-ribosylation factor GTPase-activating protein 2 isoform X2 [Nilaparvata lugens]